MNIHTLKQLAQLRAQIEKYEDQLQSLTEARRQAYEQRIDSLRQSCYSTFADYFRQDTEFEVELYDDGATACYLGLEVAILPLQNSHSDVMKIHIRGVLEVDVYHEIAVDFSSGEAQPLTSRPAESDVSRLANRLQELRVKSSSLRTEVKAIQNDPPRFIVRGLGAKSDGSTETFTSFQDYLQRIFAVRAQAA